MKTYLARVACLGQWTLNNLNLNNNNKNVYNQQKTRIDLFLDVAAGQNKTTNVAEVLKYIHNNDVINSIKSQGTMEWLNNHKPSAIIMDSFAELTDQRFDYIYDNWSFCSNYKDINHSVKFNSSFYKNGLLNLDKLPEIYDNFFAMIRAKYDCPIAFIHFPAILDKREKFHKRYNSIREAILPLVVKYDIFSVEADDDAIEPRINDHEAIVSSPYHFSDATIKHFSDKIKKNGKIK